jgi:hypothetical protein
MTVALATPCGCQARPQVREELAIVCDRTLSKVCSWQNQACVSEGDPIPDDCDQVGGPGEDRPLWQAFKAAATAA